LIAEKMDFKGLKHVKIKIIEICMLKKLWGKLKKHANIHFLLFYMFKLYK